MSVSTVLTAIAPQYDLETDRATFLSLAENQTSRCFYGNNADLAVALRAAHMMYLKNRLTGEAGNVSSKKEGDLSQSFASVNSKGDSNLNQSHFGKQLQGLQNSSNLHIHVTGGLGRCGGGTSA